MSFTRMTQPAPPDPPHRSRRAVFWVGAGAFLLVNAAGALAVRSLREEPSVDVPALETSPRAAVAVAPAAAPVVPDVEAAPEPTPSVAPEATTPAATTAPTATPTSTATAPTTAMATTAMTTTAMASRMVAPAASSAAGSGASIGATTEVVEVTPAPAPPPEPEPAPEPVVARPAVVAPVAPVVAPAPAVVALAPAPARPRGEIYVPADRTGNERAGASLLASRCGSCHGRSTGVVDPRRYTAEQWSRYFATDRHRRRAPLGETFSVAQLSDIKAFLVSRAADVRGARAAGVH